MLTCNICFHIILDPTIVLNRAVFRSSFWSTRCNSWQFNTTICQAQRNLHKSWLGRDIKTPLGVCYAHEGGGQKQICTRVDSEGSTKKILALRRCTLDLLQIYFRWTRWLLRMRLAPADFQWLDQFVGVRSEGCRVALSVSSAGADVHLQCQRCCRCVFVVAVERAHRERTAFWVLVHLAGRGTASQRRVDMHSWKSLRPDHSGT